MDFGRIHKFDALDEAATKTSTPRGVDHLKNWRRKIIHKSHISFLSRSERKARPRKRGCKIIYRKSNASRRHRYQNLVKQYWVFTHARWPTSSRASHIRISEKEQSASSKSATKRPPENITSGLVIVTDFSKELPRFFEEAAINRTTTLGLCALFSAVLVLKESTFEPRGSQKASRNKKQLRRHTRDNKTNANVRHNTHKHLLSYHLHRGNTQTSRTSEK